jgi:hypothetical protein
MFTKKERWSWLWVEQMHSAGASYVSRAIMIVGRNCDEVGAVTLIPHGLSRL